LGTTDSTSTPPHPQLFSQDSVACARRSDPLSVPIHLRPSHDLPECKR
jgi:hypothetical protein